MSSVSTGGLGVTDNLGAVPAAEASRGVQVSAWIAPQETVSFQFSVEQAGDYLLDVRHLGGELMLQAKGPSGSSGLPVGPSGPFQDFSLTLSSSDYDVTARGGGDRPVFVDWELLLNSGVGQAPARGDSLATSTPAVSLPTPSSPSAPSTPPPTPTAASPWASVVSTSMIASSDLVGRPSPKLAMTPVGPGATGGAVALASAGDAMPAVALAALGASGLEVEARPSIDSSVAPTPLLALAVLGDPRQDLAILARTAGLDTLSGLAGVMAGPETLLASIGLVSAHAGPSALANEASPDSEVAGPTGEIARSQKPEEVATLSASPGLILSGMIVASSIVRWRPYFTRPMRRRKATTATLLPASMR